MQTHHTFRSTSTLTVLASVALILVAPQLAVAQRIENQVAIFAALDKVTARISKLEIKLGDTVKFGSLKVTPRLCYSRPPDQQPKTTTFVEVQETQLDGSEKKLFSGWMFAESPGLDAVEHAVYDVWLTECKQPTKPAAQAATVVAKPGQPAGEGAPAAGAVIDEPRRRPKR